MKYQYNWQTKTVLDKIDDAEYEAVDKEHGQEGSLAVDKHIVAHHNLYFTVVEGVRTRTVG